MQSRARHTQKAEHSVTQDSEECLSAEPPGGTQNMEGIMTRHPPTDTLVTVMAFVGGELPRLNTTCRDGSLSLPGWIRHVRPALTGPSEVIGPLSPQDRIRLLQALGFVLASAERHAQAAGHQPGWILRQLPGLEVALTEASGGQRAPVLTADLYWTQNDHVPPLSFTGEAHELFFISAVRTQVKLRAVVNQQLRALVDGCWQPDQAEGARMLRAATAAMKEAHSQYLDFRKGPDGSPLMTPAQFNEMRLWLAPTVIDGRTIPGANAAYIGEMVTTDFLLGSADSSYANYIRSFEVLQPPEDRRLIAADRARASLVQLLAAALGFDSEDFDRATVSEVAGRINHAAVPLVWSLFAFKDVVDEFIGSSGAHIGLVHVYLEKYAAELSPEDLARMPVKPTAGTGGHSHDHTRQLHDMRRTSPQIRKMLTALKAAQLDIRKSA